MERYPAKGRRPLADEQYQIHRPGRVGSDVDAESASTVATGNDPDVGSQTYGGHLNTFQTDQLGMKTQSYRNPDGSAGTADSTSADLSAVEDYRSNDIGTLTGINGDANADVRRVPASNWMPRTAPVPRNADDEALLRRGPTGFIPDNLVIDDGTFFAPEVNAAQQDLYTNMEREIAHNQGQPGFANVQASIAAKSGIPMKNAGAILASASRGASSAAKKANPRLNRVK